MAIRTQALAAVIDATSVVVEVLSWPDHFSTGIPGLDSSRFDDGDRGFVWQMSAEQVRVLVLERMKKKDRLTVIMPQRVEAMDRQAITLWASGHGFSQVGFE